MPPRGRAVGLDPSLAPRFVLRLSIGTRKDATGPSSSITKWASFSARPRGTRSRPFRPAISPRSGVRSPQSASRDRKRLEARACLAPGERSVPLGAECDRVEIAEGSSRSAGRTHPTGTPLAGGAGRRRRAEATASRIEDSGRAGHGITRSRRRGDGRQRCPAFDRSGRPPDCGRRCRPRTRPWCCPMGSETLPPLPSM